MNGVLQTIFSRPDIAVLVLGAAIVITWFFVWGIVEMRKHSIDAQLKQAMIDRGMPADEIERILYASSSKTPPKNPSRATPSKPHLSGKELA